MKKAAGLTLKSSMFAVALLASTWANADFWKWTKPVNEAPSQDISTLVVIGNYAEPRILGELIQRETKQPILLLPAKGKDGIFFMPPQKRGAAMRVAVDELSNFVNFLGPKQIMVLGDSKYINKELVDRITPNRTVVVVNNQDWEAIAQSVGRLLHLTELAGDFKRLLAQFRDENQYRRVSHKAGAPVAAKPEATKISDVPAPVVIEPAPPAVKEDIQIIEAGPVPQK